MVVYNKKTNNLRPDLLLMTRWSFGVYLDINGVVVNRRLIKVYRREGGLRFNPINLKSMSPRI